jgi:two-component sensor histidine kinase
MRKQLSAILNLSRLESGLIRAEIGNIELSALIDEVVRQQRSVASENEVELTYDFTPGNRVYVRSDPAFVERILLNLIGNGIKYRSPSQATPKVRVELAVGTKQAVVSVIDNGLGIDAQHLANQAIFEPFFQANNAHPESEKGVGLGLSIVRAMVASMPEHAIEVTSDFGQGSRFRLTLPLSRSPLGPDFPRPLVPLQATSDLCQCYVVLVEDDKLVLQATLALFDVMGLRYEAYDSYEQFFNGIGHIERIPDVLLSDFRLPNQKTAVDVIALARQHFPEISVVVFSGEVGLAESHDSLPDVTIVAKPLSPHDLLQAIAGACATA